MAKPSFEELKKLAQQKTAETAPDGSSAQDNQTDKASLFDTLQNRARQAVSTAKNALDSIKTSVQEADSVARPNNGPSVSQRDSVDMMPQTQQDAGSGQLSEDAGTETPSFEYLQARARLESSAQSGVGLLNYQKYQDNVNAAMAAGNRPSFDDLQGVVRESPEARIGNLNSRVYNFSSNWNLEFSNDNWRSQEDIQALQKRYDQERSELMSVVSGLYADYGAYDPEFAEYLRNLYAELSKEASSQFGSLAEYWGRWDSADAYKAERQQRKEDAAYLTWDVAAEEANLEALKQEKKELEQAIRDYEASEHGDPSTNRRAATQKNKYERNKKRLAEVNNLIQEKEPGLSRAKDVQENYAYTSRYMEYMDMLEDPEFKENSKYKSTQNGNGSLSYISGYAEGSLVPYYYDLGFDDPLYDYINKNPEAINRVNTNSIATGENLIGRDSQFLREMTPEEIAIFNGLYNPADTSAAYEYIDFLSSDLKARVRAKDEAYWADFAKNNKFGASVFSLATSPLKSLSYLGQAVDYLDDGKLEKNAGYNSYVWSNSAIRQQVSADIEKKWGKTGSFAYNTGMSMLDFLGTTAIAGGNQTLALGIMGTGAAADMTMQCLDRGLSSDQSFALGTVAGLAEMLMENISFNALFKGDMSKGAVAYILNNAFPEGLEEVGTSAINLIADIIIARDKGWWRQSIDAYIAKGYSEAEAFGLAVGNQAASMGLDFLGGFLSGSFLGGGNYALSTMQENAGYKQMYGNYQQELVTEALTLNPYNSFALDMAEKLESGKSLSGAEIKKLAQLNENAIGNGGDQAEVDTPEGNNTVSSKLAAAAQRGQVGAAVAQQGQPQVQQNPAQEAPMSAQEAFFAETNRQIAGGNVSNSDTEAIADAVRNRAGEALDKGEIDQEAYRMAMDEIERMDMEAEGRAYARASKEVQPRSVKEAAGDAVRWFGNKFDFANKNGGTVNANTNERTQTPTVTQPGTVTGNGVSDGGQGRYSDPGTGAQTGGLGSSAAGQRGSAYGSAVASVQRQNTANDLRRQGIIQNVSSKELGLQNGTDAQNLLVIPESHWDAELQRTAERVYSETRCAVTYVVGGIEVSRPDGRVSYARGVFQSDKMILQADNKVSVEQLADHEIFHWISNEYSSMVEFIGERIMEQYSSEEFSRVLDIYKDNLWAVYGCHENASADEYEESFMRCVEEVLADAYAGINAFGAGADRFKAGVRGWMNENGILRLQSQENGTEQPTGPPVERYSFDDSYQDADSDGNQLTAEQRAYFADSQARDRYGRLLVLYHQTADVFTVFNPRHEGAGTRDQGTPFGIFMKRSANDIGLKGKYQMALYANITNPLRATSREDLNRQFRMLSSEYAEICDRIEQVNAEYRAEDERLQKAFVEYIVSWRKANPDASRKAIYDDPGFIEIYEAEDRNIEAWPEALKNLEIAAKEAITLALRNAGYDGVFLESDVGSWGRKTDAIIALDTEQVKNISNKTPSSNPDIRYSVDDGGYGRSVAEDEARVAYFEDMGAQRNQQYVEGIREAESDARLEYFEQQAELQPGEDVDQAQVAREVEEMRWRSEPKPEQTEDKPLSPIAREDLPAKARDNLARAESAALQALRRSFSVTQTNAREFLKTTVQQISDEYLASGKISKETADRLFEDAWQKGEIEDREFYEQYKDIKDKLRTTAVTLSDGDKGDIADYNQFRQKCYQKLLIVNKGGMPVDSLYEELRGMAPELFPESISHPADQLVRMYKVADSIAIRKSSLDKYYGAEAGTMKQAARETFDGVIDELRNDLWKVRRFGEDKAAQAEKKAQMPKVRTVEEALEAGNKMKNARRDSERAVRRNLLTASDEEIVGKLLRGEMSLEQLDPSKDNVAGIREVYEAKKKYEEALKPIAEYKRHVHAYLLEEADRYLETANSWKDKAMGIQYSRETMTRNVYDIIPDKTLAKQFLQKYFEPVQIAEAARTRFKTKMRNRVADMKLSRKIAKGNVVSEAHAVQLLGEAQDNIESLKQTQGYIKTRDGKTLEEWQAVILDLWENNPNLDKAKIQRSVEQFRQIYDELFTMMNEVRVRFGYEPVSYRKGYFPHFQPDGGDGIMAFFGKALGIDTQVDVLPTTINGLTHTFRPGTTWFGNAQERLGFNTVYDAVEGFDRYIEGVSDVIYHTENIQNLRALASQIRYRTSEEGLRKQVDEIRSRDNLSDTEKEELIKSILENGKYTLSNFVNELDEYTNLLANKKSRLDRAVESLLGRNRFYRLAKNLNSRVGANMVAGNVSSAMTNFIPIVQAAGRVGDKNMLRAMWDTMRSADDGIFGKSDFLASRRGSDVLVKTGVQKASEFAGGLMNLVDNFTSGTIVRAAYYKNLESGMSESEALHEADVFAAGVMAGRAKGDMPTLFHSVNPLLKAFTQFQLEVNNQYSEVFKDMPRQYRGQAAYKIAMAFLGYFVRAYLFNELFELLFGRRPALDPINLLNDFVGDATGYEIPSLPSILSGDASFKTERKNIGGTAKNLAQNALSDLPFSSILNAFIPEEWEFELDGGRVPIESAIPNIPTLLQVAFNDNWAPKYKWKKAKDELSKLMYVIPPFGGGQISKTWKGVKAYIQGGSYSMDSKGNELLQYPIYKDSPIEALGNALRTAVMGKSSVPEAVEWVEDGFDSLGAKQTAMYKDMLDAGVKARDAYELIDMLRSAEATGDKAKKDVQLDIIRSSKISDEGKAIAVYGFIDSEPMQMVMDMLDDEGVDAGTILDVVYGYRAAELLKTGEKAAKRQVILDADLTDSEKLLLVGELIGTDMETAAGKPTEYAKLLEAMDEGMSVDDYLRLVQAEGDIDDYLEYTEAGLSHTQALYVVDALEDLEPEAGEDRVSDMQKWREIADMPFGDDVKSMALEGMMRDSQYEKYSMALGAGITTYQYVYFLDAVDNLSSDKDESGKPISGSLKQKVIELIYSMPLTPSQMDALYLSKYSESGLKDTPWH